MEWREQTSVSCEEAYLEAQRWIEAVTKKTFGSNNFRSALENGVLLCDLINKIKPATIKRVNRLPTPIAGLDNLNVFLKACVKLGLKEAQLFHSGDLQDLSTRVTVKHQETSRRLKNVLITIYWLGRRAQCDRFYNGPYLNFKAFEGLLGTALYKTLHESNDQKDSSIRDSGFGDSWYSERDIHHLREGGGGHRRDDSLDSLDSLGSRPHSISSDATLKGSSEGCCSDTEADSIFRMAENKSNISYRRSLVITPKATAQFNQFLPTKDKPSGYVPAPLRKKRAEQDNRRSGVSLSYTEDEGTLTSQHNDELQSMDGSKSTSDIMEPVTSRQNRFEELNKYREQIKQSEDEWQNDLSKWKNRRRSVNSDIVKKKEEREKIEQITYGSERKSMTFKEMQEERENKGKGSISSRLKSLSFLNDEDDIFEKPVVTPYTRAHLSRSYTIDTPFHSSESFEPSRTTPEPPAASSPTLRPDSPPISQEVEEVDSSATTNSSASTIITPTTTPASHNSLNSSHAPAAAPESKTKADEHVITTKTREAAEVVSSFSLRQEEPKPRPSLLGAQTGVEAPSSGSLHKQAPQFSSMEPKPPGVSRISASLPRSYQRSDSARLTSVVAPRPFGSQSSRITSLPRAYTVDDTNKRVNGDVDVSKKTSVPSRYHQFMTPEDEAQSNSAHSSEEEEEEQKEEEQRTKMESVPSTRSVSSVMPRVRSEAPVASAPVKDASKENFCDMRINLNQKPNSSRDFGFHAAWDSTGACVTSIQPGSSAEMCQLQVGDEVLTVNGQKVAEMSYMEWRSCLETALQEGSLVMDVRRHGQNSSSETKTIKSSLDFTSRTSTETVPAKEAPTRPFVDAASNRVNGTLREELVTMRNKESEPISLKNLKRRSEFFEQGGSEAAVPDIPVPAITPSSSRWSWDPEEERKRQEKWQKEQERLLQEKYKRDQEKLQEEWLKAQQDIATSGAQLEVNTHQISPHVPAHQPTPPLWEEEERMRKMEQERQRQEEERMRKVEQERQRQEEERRKREEEEQQMQQLEEERKRRERQEEEERKIIEEEELRWQRRKEEEREEERRRWEAAEEQQRRERALEHQQQWTKSKSSPELDEDDLPPRRVSGPGVADRMGQQQSASQVELERQQILREMKKTTSLLTDNSWIRQRSSSTVTTLESEVPPMRRGESLDDLDGSSNSWRSSQTPRSSSFVQNYSRPQSALYGNSSLYTGGGSGAQRSASATLPSSYSMGSLRVGAGPLSSSWSRPSPFTPSPTTSPEPISEAGGPQQLSRSVSGKKICAFCISPLGKGAAMIIESLELCYHLSCFKCIDCKVDLGGSQAGTEVRIRNKQLYCNTCYMRFKSTQPT